jgi:hypothetical protein
MAEFNAPVCLIPVYCRASSDGPSASLHVCATIPVVRKHNATAIDMTSIFRESWNHLLPPFRERIVPLGVESRQI